MPTRTGSDFQAAALTQLTLQQPMVLIEGMPPSSPPDLAPPYTILTLSSHGAVLALPGASPVAARLGQTQTQVLTQTKTSALSLCIHADWLFEMLRPMWGEEGLVRIMTAERLFPACRRVAGVVFLEPTAEELGRMHSEMACVRGAGSLALRTGALLKLLAIANDGYLRAYPQAQSPLLPAVWRVAETIEAAAGQGLPIEIAKLAASVNLPQARFARMFRDATGVPPREYIQLRRVHHGVRMLVEDMDTVTDIAQRLGFADAAHFCRIFKRIHGVPPNEFRRRQLDASAAPRKIPPTPPLPSGPSRK